MHRHTTRGRVARFLPRLEALEDRNLLSCSVVVNNGILTITGDSAANTVTITDKGTGAPGNVKVVCDGVPTNVMPAIKGIKVNTLDGLDSVRYQLAGNLQAGVAQNVLVNLGSGNDNFVSFFSAPGGLLNNSSLGLNVKGGVGRLNWVGNTVANISPLVQMITRPRRFGRRSGTFKVVLTFRNISNLAIEGPFGLFLEDVTPGLRVVNRSGFAVKLGKPGSPFVRFDAGDNLIHAGEEFRVVVKFHSEVPRVLRFRPGIAAGNGSY